MNLNELNGPQRAMYLVLHQLYTWQNGIHVLEQIKTPTELEYVYNLEKDRNDGEFGDAQELVRTTFIETTLPAPPVNYYKVRTVACEIASGVYVGWYYLYAGTTPEAFDWVGSAFPLNATIKEVVTKEYHFEVI